MSDPIIEGLLACPCCGGEASATGVTMYSRPQTEMTWSNGTPVSEAFFCNCIVCGLKNGGVYGGYQTREEAIAAWNCRASVQTLTIKPDLREVRALLDQTDAHWQHLATISATIRINAMRHGATNAEIDAFISGEADFVEWLSAKVSPQPAAQVQAEAVAGAVMRMHELIRTMGVIPAELRNALDHVLTEDAEAALERRDQETRAPLEAQIAALTARAEAAEAALDPALTEASEATEMLAKALCKVVKLEELHRAEETKIRRLKVELGHTRAAVTKWRNMASGLSRKVAALMQKGAENG